MMRRVALMGALASIGAMLLFAATAQAHQGICTETTNPHGQTIPPAGSTTLPGPNGGQNEDGFYLISSNTGVDVFVEDLGSGTIFGPFPVGRRSSTRRPRVELRPARRSGAPTVRQARSSTTSPALGMRSSSRPASPSTALAAWSRRRRSSRKRHRREDISLRRPSSRLRPPHILDAPDSGRGVSPSGPE